MRPRHARLIESLPPTVPFLAPDVIERRSGKPLRVRLGANDFLNKPLDFTTLKQKLTHLT